MLLHRTLLLTTVLSLICLAADARRRNLLVPTQGIVYLESMDSGLKLEVGQTAMLSAQEIVLAETWELDAANVTIQGNTEGQKTKIICPPSGNAIIISATGITLRDIIFTNCTSSAVELPDLRDADDPIHAEFEHVDFISNDASRDYTQKGAAISIGSRCTATISNSTFFKNTATMGGAIYVAREANLNLKASFFRHNVATTHGGGAVFSYGSVMVEDCTFMECKSMGMFDGSEPISQLGRPLEPLTSHSFPTPGAGGGAMMLVDAPEVQIVQSNFVGNAAAAGGAISSRYKARRQASVPQKVFNIARSTFEGNKANSSEATLFFNRDIFQGGAIYIVAAQDGVRPSIESCQFTGNEARFGGALHLLTTENILSQIHNSQFVSNAAGVAGGAVLLRNTGNVDWANNNVVKNHARVGGGVFSTNNAFLTISGVPRRRDGEPLTEGFTTFTGNSAEIGGGMACVACGATIMQDPIFIDNQATRRGGGVSVEDAVSEFFMQQVQASGNKALRGGAIFVDSAASFRISAVPNTKSVIKQNMAVEGGGLYVAQAHRRMNSLQVRDVDFLENSAVSKTKMMKLLSDVMTGDELMGDQSEAETQGCENGGGGMCLVVDNIPQSSTADVLLSELSFKRNRAPIGGGLFIAISDDAWGIHSCPFNPELGSGPCRGIRIVEAEFIKNVASIRDPAYAVTDESQVFVTCDTFFDAIDDPKTLQDVGSIQRRSASKQARYCITDKGNKVEVRSGIANRQSGVRELFYQ